MTKKNDNSKSSPEFRINDKQADITDLTAINQKFEDARDKLEKQTNEIKRQYIEIFGIFAAIITFLGIEVQAFNKINSFSKLVGFSFILLASVLFLVSAIERISTDHKQKFYKNPLVWMSFVLLILAFCFFWYEVSGRVLFWAIQKVKKT